LEHPKQVNSVAISSDGSYIVSGSDDVVRVWDAGNAGNKGRERFFHYASEFVTAVALSRDDRYILAGSYDGTTYLWSAETGENICRFKRAKPVSSVAISSDGGHIVSGFDDGTVQVWVVKEKGEGKGKERDERGEVGGKGEAYEHKEFFSQHSEAVTSVAFSPNGKLVASGDSHGVAWVSDLENGQRLCSCRLDHNGPITSLTFSPDSRRIVSGSNGGTMLIWHASTGHLLLYGIGSDMLPYQQAYSSSLERHITQLHDSVLSQSDLSSLGGNLPSARSSSG
jgi:WD40 repeat protein